MRQLRSSKLGSIVKGILQVTTGALGAPSSHSTQPRDHSNSMHGVHQARRGAQGTTFGVHYCTWSKGTSVTLGASTDKAHTPPADSSTANSPQLSVEEVLCGHFAEVDAHPDTAAGLQVSAFLNLHCTLQHFSSRRNPRHSSCISAGRRSFNLRLFDGAGPHEPAEEGRRNLGVELCPPVAVREQLSEPRGHRGEALQKGQSAGENSIQRSLVSPAVPSHGVHCTSSGPHAVKRKGRELDRGSVIHSVGSGVTTS